MNHGHASRALVVAAASGILLGLTGCAKDSQPGPQDPSGATTSPAVNGTPAANVPKHACKGQNDCKGQGGCKSDKNACKGQNDCKGQGGCKTT